MSDAPMSFAPLPRLEGSVPRPLLVTSDEALLDDVLRVTATCGLDLLVAPDLAAARRDWVAATAVLVGDDVLGRLADPRSSPPARRDDLIVVSHRPDAPELWQRAVDVGAAHVITLPSGEPWLVDHLLGARAEGPAAPLLGVVAGAGGAGASTLAAALALSAHRRRQEVVLVDLDRWGGGLDALFGAETVPGARWPDLAELEGRLARSALLGALPQPVGVPMLTVGPSGTGLTATTVPPVLDAARRGGDLVVVDLPRRLDDVARAALRQATTLLVVVPARVRAVLAARAFTGELAGLVGDLRVVVRTPRSAVVGAHEVALTLGLPLAGTLPTDPHRAEDEDHGDPPGVKPRGAMASLCDHLLDDVTRRPAAA